LIRIPKRAFALFAGFVVISASACSGSSATLPGGPNFNPTDANSIVSAAISGGPDVKSFHLKIEVKGTIKTDALSGAAGDASGMLGGLSLGDLKLDGTAIEGDIDIANEAAHLALTVPPIAAMGGIPIAGDAILKDGALYYKIDLFGSSKYTKADLGSLTSGLPIAIPTAGASALAGVQDQVTQIQKTLDDAGAKATLVGTDQVAGKDAYHVNVSIPLDLINGGLASAAPSAASGMKIDSASVDLWVYKENNLLAKAEVKAAASAVGNLDVIVTVTDYDKPVTISAPSADQITP
jgi:hypothetical protein